MAGLKRRRELRRAISSRELAQRVAAGEDWQIVDRAPAGLEMSNEVAPHQHLTGQPLTVYPPRSRFLRVLVLVVVGLIAGMALGAVLYAAGAAR